MWNDIPEMGCMLVKNKEQSIEEHNKQGECKNKFTYEEARRIIAERNNKSTPE